MPQFNTGTSWDQGLNALGSYLFKDPASIAQAGLYGAQTRREGLEADMIQRKIGGQNDYSDALRRAGEAPMPTSSPQAPMPTPQPVAPPPVAQDESQLASMASAAPPAGLAAVFSQGASMPGALPEPDGIGGGTRVSGPAAPNGSPARAPFDIGPATDALIRMGVNGDQLKAGIGAILGKAVASGRMSQQEANQYMLDFNPSEAAQGMRQQYTTQHTMQPVWDMQLNRPTEIPQGEYEQDGGKRYRAIDQQSQTSWNSPGRYYNPAKPGASLTMPMYVGAQQGGVQVTQNGAQEAAGGFIARGTPPTQQEYQTVTGAASATTPPPVLDPNDQARNRGIDDQELQRMFPVTANRTDVNHPIMLDDPHQEVASRADELQRTRPEMRSNRALAYSTALKEFQAQGRIGEVHRETSYYGRHAPGMLTGQVGENADVVEVTGAKGKKRSACA